MPATRKAAPKAPPPGPDIQPRVHVVTVGLTPPGSATDVVEAIIADIKPMRPTRVAVIATHNSEDNARRVIKGLKLKAADSIIRLIESPQSLDEAYRATNEVLVELIEQVDVAPRDIMLHYTAGTKVMSAGAVLAALNFGIRSMRYLYSPGRQQESIPVDTELAAVLIDREVHLAMRFLEELRFRAARDVLERIDKEPLGERDRQRLDLLNGLALAYSEWDTFRLSDFVRRYTPLHEPSAAFPELLRFRLQDRHFEAMKALVAELEATPYPLGLLLDLVNNVYRRLAERRPDDAMIRLHRAAEMYAQGLLLKEFQIRTDDLDIRKVPPRSRTAFEAERRIDDATIKLGMRRSFDLLGILGHQVGLAFREREPLQKALLERRNLMLAHGTSPAHIPLALEFLAEVGSILKLRIPNLEKRLSELQFPWIRNREVLQRLQKSPVGNDTVAACPPEPKKTQTGRRRRSR